MSGVRLNIKSNFFTLNNKTMFFYLLFFHLLSKSMATGSTNDSTSYDMSNKIICGYQDVVVDAKRIPCECDAILYSLLIIDQSSIIDVDEKLLKSVVDLKKPVIAGLRRTQIYSGWSEILDKNGNANETKMLCDFAKNHSIQGYDFWDLYPYSIDTVDRNITKNFIPYIKQLKELCPFLIISVSVATSPAFIKNIDIYNFEELNKVLTYYNINSVALNVCNPKLYNGVAPISPITNCNISDNYLYTLEEVVSYLKETKICFNKISISIPLGIDTIDNDSVFTYTQMCEGVFNNSTMCVQTSKNYYEKGQFCSKQKFGIIVVNVVWDDSTNACNCTSTFNGFRNIYAGYNNCPVIPCMRFDVQSIDYYPYK